MKMRYIVIALVAAVIAFILIVGTHPFGQRGDQVEERRSPNAIGQSQ
ncbi:hypothetical protein [Rhizobium sullae]|uniref:Ti type entry exclusion protein TrbK n=1 Tax=Rhizobium sullae TaxID=50338 RepID=A0A4V2V812_RHISU|nr:hypothetical protein [Rhizobium sullae]TCU09641.1 hypothetical protein EV132_12441 [Rhizobium sullae]